MFLAVALDVVVVAWLLWRQLKVRRVWPRLTLRLAAILCVIGLVELLAYAGSHHVSGEAVGVLTLSFVVGAVALGALRALTVKIWRAGPGGAPPGDLADHGAVGALLGPALLGRGRGSTRSDGQSGVVSASLLLWLGITYGVQNAVVHRRAEGLLEPRPAPSTRAPRWPACGSGSAGGRVRAGPAGWAGSGGPGAGGGPAAHAGAIEASSEVVDDQPAGAERPGDRRARRRAPPYPARSS